VPQDRLTAGKAKRTRNAICPYLAFVQQSCGIIDRFSFLVIVC